MLFKAGILLLGLSHAQEEQKLFEDWGGLTPGKKNEDKVLLEKIDGWMNKFEATDTEQMLKQKTEKINLSHRNKANLGMSKDNRKVQRTIKKLRDGTIVETIITPRGFTETVTTKVTNPDGGSTSDSYMRKKKTGCPTGTGYHIPGVNKCVSDGFRQGGSGIRNFDDSLDQTDKTFSDKLIDKSFE